MTTPSTTSVKSVLITGASRGIGRAIALKLAGQGIFTVITYAQNEGAAQETVAQLRSVGPGAVALKADLTNPADIDALIQALPVTLEEHTGSSKLYGLINNAGAILSATIEETSLAQLDDLYALNMRGPFALTQGLLPHMLDGGRIINLGTGLTRFSMGQYIAYSMTKGAIDTFTNVLAKHLGPRKITVNTLAPGAVATDMNPWLKTEEGQKMGASLNALGRVGQPEDIAAVAAFLISEASGWLTAQRIEASGGQHL